MADEPEQPVCTYCEKPGQLLPVRKMPGQYHLRCIPAAKKAWELIRPRTLGQILVERYVHGR